MTKKALLASVYVHSYFILFWKIFCKRIISRNTESKKKHGRVSYLRGIWWKKCLGLFIQEQQSCRKLFLKEFRGSKSPRMRQGGWGAGGISKNVHCLRTKLRKKNCPEGSFTGGNCAEGSCSEWKYLGIIAP